MNTVDKARALLPLYRLDVFSIELPPLRNRRADIPGLAELLLGQLAKKCGRPKSLLRPEDMRLLQEHDFPGNVRELRNVLERSLLRSAEEGHWLTLDSNWLNRKATAFSTPGVTVSIPSPRPAERDGLNPIEAEEYRLIGEAMRLTNGGIRRAASKLGLSRQALLRRLEKWPELRGAQSVT